jgi:subtilisin-like proprotein convertase family protein
MKTNAWKNARHVALLLVLFLCALALMSLAVTPQSAQDKQEDTGTTENISINNPTEKDFSNYYKADRITRAVRDKAMMPVRVIVQTDADREEAKRLGMIIEDYGTFVVVAASKNQNLSNSRLETAEIKTTVHLPGKSFDPLQNPPTGSVRADGTSINFDSKDYYIVQFGGIANDELLDSLRATGVEILQYVPHQAFFVYGDGEAIQKVANHSRVRWVGRFMAEDKLSPVLLAQLAATKGAALDSKISPMEMTGRDTAVFDIAIWARADMNAVKDAVISLDRVNVKHLIKLPNNYFNVVQVEMPLDAIAEVAKLSDVITIDPYFTPKAEDERAAHIVAGNYTNTTTISGPGYNPLTQFGVDGTNVTVGVSDDGISIPGVGGFYITATNTVNGPLRGAASGATGGHGHINASITAGGTPFGNLDPTGHNYGVGVAPKANIINIPFLVGGYTGTNADTFNDTVTTAGPNGVLGSISNNSWGSGTNGNVYDAFTASFDGFVRDASATGTIDPIVIVFSAGNSGANGLTRPKVAKNVIATGSSENLRTELGGASANNLDDMSGFSSRGPAADMRIKPDITAPGDIITGGRAGSCTSVTSCFEANHAFSSGTSHAAPQIAGVAALFTQFWKNNNAGANPSPALVKAAILLTGQEMGGVGATNPLPNGDEGWGRANMKFMLNTGVPTRYVNQTTEFTDVGNSSTIAGTVADATKPVRITLVWTDPPGAANANPALVNNLDLTVTVGANTYRGNVFSGGSSTTGGTADTRNNIEHIWLPAGIAVGTTVTIQIGATAINGDGILGNADPTDQHFALVAYNFNLAGGCVSSVNPTNTNMASGGGPGSFNVVAGGACNWTATTSDAWINITAGTGTGNGTVSFTATANPTGLQRTGTILVQGQAHTVTQAASGCTYSINPTSQNFPASGGNGTVNVTTLTGCAWTANSNGFASTEAIFSNANPITINDLKNTTTTSAQSDDQQTQRTPESITAIFNADAPSLGAIPDGPAGVCGTFTSPPRDVTFTVSGISGTITDVRVGTTFSPAHTWRGDLSVELRAPGGTPAKKIFESTGSTTAGGCGSANDAAGPYIFFDTATPATSWWLNTGNPTTAGNYKASTPGGVAGGGADTTITPAFAGVTNANGTWTLRILDGGGGDTGSISAATLEITSGAPACITVTSGQTGNGSGTVGYTVSQNTGANTRQCTMTIGGQTFTACQNGTSQTCSTNPTRKPIADFDGDNKTDLSIFRPSLGQWWYQKSSDNMVTALTFGTSTDRITPGDYDGDGKADVAFWRPATGEWFVLRSSNLTFFAAPFGMNGDTPAPGDFDGDGKFDLTVFRPSNTTWFTLRSSDNGVTTTPFGLSTDAPQPSDYDGDGKADVAIFRPMGGSGNAEWWLLRSSNGSVFATPFGSSTDKPIPGDYTGDGKCDIAFWRPATSNWFILRSEDLSFFAAPWGSAGDVPVPGDYDGDSKYDLAVFRPTNSTWFVLRSSGGNTAQAFGTTGDRPVPNAYVP